MKITKEDYKAEIHSLEACVKSLVNCVKEIEKNPGLHTEGSYFQIAEIAMRAASYRTKVTAYKNFLE